MNWVDYLIIIVVALSGVISLFRGFTSEILSLAVWGAAVTIAVFFLPSMELLLSPYIDVPSVRTVAGFALLFVLTLMVGALVKMIFRELIQATGLTTTDRLVGAVFGIARGTLIVLVSVILLRWTELVHEDPWWQESTMIPYFSQLAEWSSSRTDFILENAEKAKRKAEALVESAVMD
jgi:membrane protein required for colicin V production